jgi:hypothetical protein
MISGTGGHSTPWMRLASLRQHDFKRRDPMSQAMRSGITSCAGPSRERSCDIVGRLRRNDARGFLYYRSRRSAKASRLDRAHTAAECGDRRKGGRRIVRAKASSRRSRTYSDVARGNRVGVFLWPRPVRYATMPWPRRPRGPLEAHSGAPLPLAAARLSLCSELSSACADETA